MFIDRIGECLEKDIKLEGLVGDIFKKYSKWEDKGKLADYIPELKKANIGDLAISIWGPDFQNLDFGVHDKAFTLQSISKIISLTIAIMDNGLDFVMDRVGFKGSTSPFNSLYKLDFENIKSPDNPMLNAGAILTTSLIKGSPEEKLEKILGFIRMITGNRTINYNEDVYKSEKATGDKNKSIAYLLKARNMLEPGVEETLDLYFKQCSIEVTNSDLARIAGFYSNGGRDLRTGQSLCDRRIISSVNAIMAMAGMYDYSGEYAVLVGIPSKSGVSGGIIGVVPNRMGIAIYSPGLDESGNSLIGLKAIKEISEKLNLSLF